MRTVETKVYTFAELSPVAQNKAIEQYNENASFDCDPVFEDACEIGSLFGLEIDFLTLFLCDIMKSWINQFAKSMQDFTQVPLMRGIVIALGLFFYI